MSHGRAMSADLCDLKRLRVTARTKAWLSARAHSTGRTQQDIARDALDSIAAQEIHAARVLASMAPAEAPDGDGEGRTP
jgi:hypothetical protein